MDLNDNEDDNSGFYTSDFFGRRRRRRCRQDTCHSPSTGDEEDDTRSPALPEKIGKDLRLQAEAEV